MRTNVFGRRACKEDTTSTRQLKQYVYWKCIAILQAKEH